MNKEKILVLLVRLGAFIGIGGVGYGLIMWLIRFIQGH